MGVLNANVSASIADIARSLASSGHKLTTTSDIPDRDADKVLRILSIVAKLSGNSTGLKRGYICIEVGEQAIMTPVIKSKSN